jgi:hypothetical protein
MRLALVALLYGPHVDEVVQFSARSSRTTLGEWPRDCTRGQLLVRFWRSLERASTDSQS